MSRTEMHTLTFDSLVEAANFARTTPRDSGAPDSSGKLKDDNTWDLDMNLEQTLAFVASGEIWEKGLNNMTDAMEITDTLAARSVLPRVNSVIAGGAVSIGRYVTGDPRCMRRRQKSPAVDKPVLSIGIQLGIAWSVSAEQKLNFGAALLSVIDELERSGYRCEVVALWRASGNNGPDYKHYVNIEYNLKQPQDRWNPASLAYAIAHPAFIRRMTWRIAETQHQWNIATHSCYCTNENTKHLRRSLSADFDIYFDCLEPGNARKCDRPAGAFEYVTGVVNKQLATAQEGADKV